MKKEQSRRLGYQAAIAAGTAVCAAAKRASEEYAQEHHSEQRFAARVACLYALDNIWYDHMTEAAKTKFNFDRAAYQDACGWPN